LLPEGKPLAQLLLKAKPLFDYCLKAKLLARQLLERSFSLGYA
jgi:hypothetical protein